MTDDEGLEKGLFSSEVAAFRGGKYLVSDFARRVLEWAHDQNLDLSVEHGEAPPAWLVHRDYRFLGPVRFYAKEIRKAGGWPRWMAAVVVGYDPEYDEVIIFDGGHRVQAAKAVGMDTVPVLALSHETYQKVNQEFHIERGLWLYILAVENLTVRGNLRKAELERKRHWPFDD